MVHTKNWCNNHKQYLIATIREMMDASPVYILVSHKHGIMFSIQSKELRSFKSAFLNLFLPQHPFGPA